jgi:putative ABC transport system permease protein
MAEKMIAHTSGRFMSILPRRVQLSAPRKDMEESFMVTGFLPTHFLDETFDHQYKSDEQLATVITWFTGLAAIIACLGLFALSSFMITRRTKEIGIRKSMGASTRSIYTMLSWDFLKWIVVAVIIACPIAWYFMQLWLNKFAYHITLGTDIFIVAALFAIGVALLTVTWQSLKAATANPIKSLRYE